MTARGPHPVIIHAHFYPPPREDPWLDALEREPGAAPVHDWNERIERECYRAVVAARLPGPDGRIRRILNTLDWISFNAGPTLLEWMEGAAPDTYRRFLEADQRSVARLGHGNALAMPYHHTILPLASRRDKVTEVRWGMADFRRRFGREPEGMWLPETAVDDETLEVLAESGIRFTILAPGQVQQPPPNGLPGLYRTSGGRSIAVVVYHGALSHQVAFGPLIQDGAGWLAALAAQGRGGEAALTAIATDGETYGHHHKFGEMALAAVIDGAAAHGLELTNLAAYLARHPATEVIHLVEPSSWSCAHGVERWRSNCGCRLEPVKFPSQEWRTPLRDALTWLAGELHGHFERESALLVDDPWAARDAMEGLPPSPLLLPAARELLEMERNALRMFTSCGWFFDDIGGIESLQCLRYAVRAIELAGPDRDRLMAGLATRLEPARSNDPLLGSGADLLRHRVLSPIPAAARIAAGHAAMQLFPWGLLEQPASAWEVEPDDDDGLRLTDRRTGASVVTRGSVGRDESGRLRFRIAVEEGEGTVTLGLGDLPEAARAVVRAAITAALFPAELAASLQEIGVPGREALAARLLELLPGDMDLPSLDPALLHGALDLLDLDGAAVPFDSQSRFHEVMTSGSPAVRAALAPFASRFGFATDAFAPVEP